MEGTRNLISAMKNGFDTLVFSSSAAVYGEQDKQPVSETFNPLQNQYMQKQNWNVSNFSRMSIKIHNLIQFL